MSLPGRFSNWSHLAKPRTPFLKFLFALSFAVFVFVSVEMKTDRKLTLLFENSAAHGISSLHSKLL
jgi:hypothetical protein